MAFYSVREVGSIGLVRDQPPFAMTEKSWTEATNVKFRGLYTGGALGYAKAFSTAPAVPPFFLLDVISANQENFVVYAGGAKVYAYDGTTHSNITRQVSSVDVDYHATVDLNWTGGVLEGVPILSNRLDVPQMWVPVSATTRLQDLTAWDSTWRCRALRPFRGFLVALGLTKGAVEYPQMVKWSSSSDPGSVPASWDEASTTNDAGETTLADTPGACVDCASLGGINVVYKEDSIWLMQYVGGQFIFNFAPQTKMIGLMAQGCLTELPGPRHVVFGLDDIVMFDGRGVTSIVEQRIRASVFGGFNYERKNRTFMINDSQNHEVWMCYPESGEEYATRALVWNWQIDAFTFRDIPASLHGIFGGAAVLNPATTWDATTETWDDIQGTWDSMGSKKSESLIVASPLNTLAYRLNFGTSADGASMISRLERTGIMLPSDSKSGPNDLILKTVRGIRLGIDGEIGAIVDVSVGFQQTKEGPITWKVPVPFVIGQDTKVDCLLTGRLFAFRIEAPITMTWRLVEYGFDFAPRGVF